MDFEKYDKNRMWNPKEDHSMSKNGVDAIYRFRGPADKPCKITTDTGKTYQFDKSMHSMINDLKAIPLKDLLTILEISDEAIESEQEQRLAFLCNIALEYLKASWLYSETGEKLQVDQELIEDFLNQDVTKRTVYRRLKDRRMSIQDVKVIIKFFESNNLTKK